jgi:anaerobic selenocysteine-containing dehydrogenase
MKRNGDGEYEPIGSGQAMDEIAERVSGLIDRYGPKSIAFYFGTGSLTFPLNVSIGVAWMQAIGSPWIFTANTIDKPGAQIALAAHGNWSAGHPPFEEAEAWLIVGANPVISKSGLTPNNPAKRLKEAVTQRGMKLIVIDPRASEVTQRARIHLQSRPGEDPAILAAMIHVILAEERYDEAFVADHVEGVEALAKAVAPFTPAYAASRAGVDAERIVEAARIFADARYAGAVCGTGPSFSMAGSVSEYLALVMTTLCGFWSREGDLVQKPNILLPAYEARAEAMPPFQGWGYGAQLRVRGLGQTIAGLPTGALADEILLGGEDGIKALFCLSGNPMMAWPDQRRAREALASLDLLVTQELEMSATARVSDYVIAPKLSLEMPGSTGSLEALKYYGNLKGLDGTFARYTPAVTDPPLGSDVIGDWELYYGLAQRMGLSLTVTSMFGLGKHLEAAPQFDELDMSRKPTDDDLLTMTTRAARIPLSAVKAHPHGRMFSEVREFVQPARPGNEARLDVGNASMLGELQAFEPKATGTAIDKNFPFLLIPRRMNKIQNSGGRTIGKLVDRGYNPAFLHSSDLAVLGVSAGDQVRLISRFGEVLAIAGEDDTIRPGCISITHAFGGNPDEQEAPGLIGCNVGRLMSASAEYDPISGIPRMGALPVRVQPS